MRILFEWRSVHTYRWLALLSLSLLWLLQACGDTTTFTSLTTNGGSGTIGINHVQFDGNLLFVKAGNLFILHGKDDSLTQLTRDGTALQPSLSPDHSTIAFALRQSTHDYSDLATMPLAGGSVTLHTNNRLLCLCDPDANGVYHYEFWVSNPIWTADGKNIIYLSDFFKGGRTTTPFTNQTCLGNSSTDWILDLGIVESSANVQAVPAVASNGQTNPPKQLAWPYCYAGGDQDLSLRPGTSNTQVLFTSFRYVGSNDLAAQLSLLSIPSDGSASSLIQLNAADPTVVPLEPSFSPDGKSITYIRRQNGEDDLYVMPFDATITGTPTDESYALDPNGTSVYYTNTSSYQQSRKLASGIIGQPVWGGNNTIFFTEFSNGAFNLFMAKVRVSSPASVVTLAGPPVLLTQGGIDGTSRPDWYR